MGRREGYRAYSPSTCPVAPGWVGGWVDETGETLDGWVGGWVGGWVRRREKGRTAQLTQCPECHSLTLSSSSSSSSVLLLPQRGDEARQKGVDMGGEGGWVKDR